MENKTFERYKSITVSLRTNRFKAHKCNRGKMYHHKMTSIRLNFA